MFNQNKAVLKFLHQKKQQKHFKFLKQKKPRKKHLSPSSAACLSVRWFLPQLRGSRKLLGGILVNCTAPGKEKIRFTCRGERKDGEVGEKHKVVKVAKVSKGWFSL